ncbi:MAG: site-2 protease family protein [Rhodospirillaceae bacterium]|nr:site-2 protease family protein [Rhodospirillaceae bacterium]
MSDLPGLIQALLVVAPVAIIAITFHEAAHGFVAYKLGDPTAYLQGRVSFNPLRHIDPLGTVVLPLVLFVTSGWLLGWAKPVPVNPSRLNSPRRDMVLVAAAGPGINLALALVSAVLLALLGGGAAEPEYLRRLLGVSIYFNVLIAVFNLIPIPPLDGGRIAVGLLPGSLAYPLARMEPYGMWLVIGILLIVPWVSHQLGADFSPFRAVIQPIVSGIIDFMGTIVGLGRAL